MTQEVNAKGSYIQLRNKTRVLMFYFDSNIARPIVPL